MNLPTLEQLMEAGAHYGHIRGKWNPKMKPYIFSVRNNTHIFNIEKTIICLKKGVEFIQQLISEDKTILFIGTKRQAKDAIKNLAQSLEMPYINFRWLGGTLTNFNTIQQALKKFENLEKQKKDQKFFGKLTKKEQKNFSVKLEKMDKTLSGLRRMNSLPDALFVIDANQERVAILEANNLNIPIIGIIDSSADPAKIDYPIPANDDSRLTIDLLLNSILTACQKDKAKKSSKKIKQEKKVSSK